MHCDEGIARVNSCFSGCPGSLFEIVGSLVVEKIFTIPGMGRYFVEAAVNRS